MDITSITKNSMTNIIVVSLVLLVSASFYASSAFAAKPITVSRAQFGDEWPFLREEMMLECKKGQKLFAINENSLVSYPLNEAARISASGSSNIADIDKALKVDPANTSQKMSYENIVQKALTLCE